MPVFASTIQSIQARHTPSPTRRSFSSEQSTLDPSILETSRLASKSHQTLASYNVSWPFILQPLCTNCRLAASDRRGPHFYSHISDLTHMDGSVLEHGMIHDMYPF